MLPIIFSVAKRFGGSVLRYAFPVAGAFAVMHAFYHHIQALLHLVIY